MGVRVGGVVCVVWWVGGRRSGWLDGWGEGLWSVEVASILLHSTAVGKGEDC